MVLLVACRQGVIKKLARQPDSHWSTIIGHSVYRNKYFLNVKYLVFVDKRKKLSSYDKGLKRTTEESVCKP